MGLLLLGETIPHIKKSYHKEYFLIFILNFLFLNFISSLLLIPLGPQTFSPLLDIYKYHEGGTMALWLRL